MNTKKAYKAAQWYAISIGGELIALAKKEETANIMSDVLEAAHDSEAEIVPIEAQVTIIEYL
jgi:hypothetical protein